MINLEYFDFNHSVVRIYREDSGKVWYLKEDILKLVRLDKSSILPAIAEENELRFSLTNYLKSVPNLSDNPKTISSVKVFIDSKGLEILLRASSLSEELKISLINWINQEIIKDNKSESISSEKDNILESKSFRISDSGILETSTKLSEREYLENQFYDNLELKIRDRIHNLTDNREYVEKGIRLVLDYIKENNLELKTFSGIRLERISGADYDIHIFSKKIKLMIESFLKDLKGIS